MTRTNPHQSQSADLSPRSGLNPPTAGGRGANDRHPISPRHLVTLNGGYALADPDQQLADEGLAFVGSIIAKTVIVVLAVVSTYLVVTLP